jgi:ABC-type transport system substrate-binding protein
MNCLAGVCLVLLFIVSQATSATTAKPATSPVPVSVLGCPQGPPSSGLTPQYGGTLKIIYPGNVANLGEPWKPNTAGDVLLSRFAVESLIGLDTNGNPVPQLATGWVSDPVKKTIIFTLRQGVKFHDGTDFNAAAAKWYMDTFRNGVKPDLRAVTAIDVIDDYHLRISLSSWDPLFVQSLYASSAARMISPTAVQKLGDAAKLHPVGTGPFKFVSFEPSVSLKFTRFEGYWQKGLPYLDAVEINFVADQVVSLTSFTKGEAHVLINIATDNAKALKDKGNIIDRYTAAIYAIGGDSKNKNSPFADMRIRQAIAYAIDNETVVNSVFGGMYPPTNQLALPGFQAYNKSIKGYPYNPAKAKEFLAAAGYSMSKPLTQKLTYQTGAQYTDLFTAVQGYLKEVGIHVTLEPLDQAAFSKLNSSGWNNQLLAMGWSYNGLQMQYSTSLTRGLSAKQFTYVSLWTPDDFHKLYNVMLAENDMAKREAYYQQLNKMAIDDHCLLVPLFGLQSLTAKSPKVHDLGMCHRTGVEFLPETGWLSK